MKDGTPESPKFDGLKLRLGLAHWETIGLLEAIWLFTRRQAARGDIGRWSDEQIARAIGWTRSSGEEMVAALVAERWLDRDPEHRLIVHDWSKHADDGINLTLTRRREDFADGSAPRPPMNKIHSSDRGEILKWLKKKRPKRSATGAATGGAMAAPQSATGAATGSAMVIPAPSRLALPGHDRAASPYPSAVTEPSCFPVPGEPHGNGNGVGKGHPPEPGGGGHGEHDPSATMTWVLEEIQRLQIPASMSGPFLLALHESCTRHPEPNTWGHVLQEIPKNRNPNTGEGVTMDFVVAAEIESPTHRAQYADERIAKVRRRFYADA